MIAITQVAGAVVLFAIGAAMVFYEWIRIKAGKPILNGHGAVQIYWMGYLASFVLGVTLMLAAILR
jgi:hypothetical protein